MRCFRIRLKFPKGIQIFGEIPWYGLVRNSPWDDLCSYLINHGQVTWFHSGDSLIGSGFSKLSLAFS